MKSVLNVKTLLLTATMVLVSFACNNGSTSPYSGGSSTPTTQAAPNTVLMSNYTFSPGTLTVAKGTVVTWQNNDPVAHTSTSDNGTWDTGSIASRGSKTTTFNTTGTFTYHCTVHPMMTGTVVVQ